MAKKKTAQKIQLLSPENYIRQRSRNLPLHGCWVNSNWQDEKMATVVVARKHVSGNITYAIYLVDLLCLGVKESFFRYNESECDFDNFREKLEETLDLYPIPYNLAHNIIYSAIEFAEEYGFEPYWEFTTVTKYLLEEDTDDIPLIEVVCGDEDGKPLYIRGDLDSPARVKQILAQLEKTAGDGNYHYILDAENFDDYDDNDDYDEDEDEETSTLEYDLAGLSNDELKEHFLELIAEKNNSTEEYTEKNINHLFITGNLLIDRIIDEDVLDNHYGNLVDNLLVKTVVENECLPNSLFQGIQDTDGESVLEMFFDAIDSIGYEDKPKKKLKEMRNRLGDVPMNDYLDFHLLLNKHNSEMSKCSKKLEEYRQKHPGYFLFELYWNEYLYVEKNDESALERIKALPHQTALPLSEFEYAEFVMKYAIYHSGIRKENISFEQLIAIEDFVQDRLLSYQPATVGLLATIAMLKIVQLTSFLEKEAETR